MEEKWITVSENEVRCVWKKSMDDDCGCGPDTVEVSPAWYEEHGTPMCCCGQDLYYRHTLVKFPERPNTEPTGEADDTMPAYIRRMLDEFDELKTRYLKLHNFIESSTFSTVDQFSRKLLVEQRTIMESYIDILYRRLQTSKW